MIDRRPPAAMAALDTARQIVARLGLARDPEDTAADLIESWSAVETALRSLLGGSAQSGVALISEVRQRQLLTLDQANALAAFHSASERAQITTYRPTVGDVDAAREGFLKLEASLLPGTPTPHSAPTVAMPPEQYGPPPSSMTPSTVAPPSSPRRTRAVVALVLLVLLLLGAGAYLFQRTRSPTARMERAIALYAAGQREPARAQFAMIARDHPDNSMAHVYLARLAREERDFGTAIGELQAAIRADTGNAVAMREMGALQFSLGRYEVARIYYVRAVRLAPRDRMAQGYLGCTLLRLGRFAEGMRFLQRAGQGAWTSCAQSAPPPGFVPPA